MRAVVQRAAEAHVRVDGDVVGRLDRPGLVVLVGATHGDDASTASRLASKIWGLRILDGDRSASDVGAPGPVAEPLVTAFADALRRLGAHVETGRFGAHMQVHLVNDGPVTVILDS